MKQQQLFTILDAVESTNNYAMAKVRAGLAEAGEAVFARDQWGGKGQRENKWESAKDENILMTIIMKPDKHFNMNLFHFNAFIASVCHQFLQLKVNTNCFIKWPNDIYFGDRKAGGILIENVFNGKEWAWAIVGIGININQTEFGENSERATSLKQICNLEYDPITLAKELHHALILGFEAINQLPETYYFDYYNRFLYKKSETVKLRKDNIIFSTCIKEVTKNGELCTIDAIERTFRTGEIKWV